MNLNPSCYPDERRAPESAPVLGSGAAPASSKGHRPLEVLTAAYVAIGLSASQAAASARADLECIFGGEEFSA